MSKAMRKIKWFALLPVWAIMLAGYFAWNFFQMVWLKIKKTKTAQKLIYSNFVQSQKERILGKAKITKEQLL